MTHHLAVFGDVHGRIALMLALARRWQREHDRRLLGILQVGDLGAFPDHDRLDRSTRRYARHDPDELGFVDFLSPSRDGTALLAPEESPAIAFCRGNHEDFSYLERFATPTPLDPWRKLWFVPDGQARGWPPPEHAPGVAPIRLAAFGGAAPLQAAEGRGRSARKERRKAERRDLTISMGPRFRAQDLARTLRRDLGPVDVLMTHAGPAHPSWSGGSRMIADLAKKIQPRVHLFGHHHQVVGPISTPHGLLVGLEHLEFLPDRTLRPGSWGILSLDASSVGFAWVERDSHPWRAEFTRDTWRSLV